MYRAKKNYIHKGKRIKVNDPLSLDKTTIQDFMNRGLAYETKEEKKAFAKNADAYIEKDETTKTMYFVKKNNQIIDRLPKSKAQKLVKELNA